MNLFRLRVSRMRVFRKGKTKKSQPPRLTPATRSGLGHGRFFIRWTSQKVQASFGTFGTSKFGCVDGDREIPDPIPNSEVKPVSGDGTALLSVGE
jgi:hypothetical protein